MRFIVKVKQMPLEVDLLPHKNYPYQDSTLGESTMSLAVRVQQRVDEEILRRVAEEIADALGEHDVVPRLHILGVVRVLGPDAAREVLEEARHIQDAGGLWLPDHSRKRTFGGIFFQVAKERLGTAWPETLQEVHRWRQQKREMERRRKEEEERARLPWDRRHGPAMRALRQAARLECLDAVVRWVYDERHTRAVNDRLVVAVQVSLDENLLPRVVPRPTEYTFPIIVLLNQFPGNHRPGFSGKPVTARGAVQLHSQLGLMVTATGLQIAGHPPQGEGRLFVRGRISRTRARPVRVNKHLLVLGAMWEKTPVVFYLPARLWRHARTQDWRSVSLGGQVVMDGRRLTVLVEEVREGKAK